MNRKRQKRWETFSKHEQLGHIGTELLRANHFENDDRELYQGCLERAMDLVTGNIIDPKWKYMKDAFIYLYGELEKLHEGESTGVLKLYNAL